MLRLLAYNPSSGLLHKSPAGLQVNKIQDKHLQESIPVLYKLQTFKSIVPRISLLAKF